jgi:predicted DNA-binding transcriptional regulator AlpA
MSRPSRELEIEHQTAASVLAEFDRMVEYSRGVIARLTRENAELRALIAAGCTADEQHMSPEQVARLVGLSEKRLADFRATGEGPPHFKHARAVRYRRSEVEAWLEGKRRGGIREHSGSIER